MATVYMSQIVKHYPGRKVVKRPDAISQPDGSWLIIFTFEGGRQAFIRTAVCELVEDLEVGK